MPTMVRSTSAALPLKPLMVAVTVSPSASSLVSAMFSSMITTGLASR